ncbi:MAG: glycosyltransferase family 2 protein [Eubacterium sp.]|nr:glycosyltransferase family 2 protein [Eubacterium sp.]
MANPKFSFLIPVYNQKGKMDKCIESVKAQTYTDFEVVLVNDGSTDGSGEMLEEMAKEDERFKVFTHETNLSLLRARFTGMKNATGDYLVFLDSDDFVDPDLLRALDELIEAEHPDVIKYGRVIEPFGLPKLPDHFDDPLRTFLEGNTDPRIVETCVSAEIAKKAVECADPPYVNNAEDTYMTGTLYTFAKKFAYLDKPYYHYQIFGGMSRTDESLDMEKLKRVRQSLDNCSVKLLEFYEKYNPELAHLCARASANTYKYETLHFVLNAKDECTAIDFINALRDDRYPDVFEVACKQILPEFFRRRLIVGYTPDRPRFYFF